MNKLKELEVLLKNTELMNALFQTNIPEIDFAALTQQKRNDISFLFRCMMLGYYIHNCLMVVSVTVRGDYDLAFSIFDSLNTTGKRLTPLESLKPEIVATANDNVEHVIQDLENCKELTLFKEIDSIVNHTVLDTKDKEKLMENIVIVFILVLSGERCPKSSLSQRKQLRDKYLSMNKIDKIDFLKLFKSVATIFKTYENNTHFPVRHIVEKMSTKVNYDSKMGALAEEANFSLNYLKHCNCYLGLAIIARYYHEAAESNEKLNINETCDNVLKFLSVINATAGFYAIWRASDAESQRINDVFRNSFSNKPDVNDANSIHHYNSVYYNFDEKIINPIPCEEDLFKYYVDYAKAKKLNPRDISQPDMSKWIRKVKEVELYDVSKPTAKMLLITGLNQISDQLTADGQYLLVNNNDETKYKTIKERSYTDEKYGTIEHIIPRNETGGLKEYDRLWNLILLPQEINSYFQDTSFSIKSKLYRLFAADTDHVFDEIVDTLSSEHKDAAKKIRDYVKTHKCLPILKVLADNVGDKHTAENSDERINTILGVCWSKFAVDWLKWPVDSGKDDTEVRS